MARIFAVGPYVYRYIVASSGTPVPDGLLFRLQPGHVRVRADRGYPGPGFVGVVCMTSFKVGRSPQSDIVISDASVSRSHAELVRREDSAYDLKDLGSSYGTYVKREGNWEKVEEAMVQPDEPLMLGNYRTTAANLVRKSGVTIKSGEGKVKTGEGSSAIRRLAAILAADVVGYSRLMGEDEQGTLDALKQCRQSIFDPAVDRYRGRVFKVIGDGILAEFASVVDGVRCALDIQTKMMGAAFGESKIRMIFRMGINIGDVIADGEDIYGDGVNIAARLESLSEAGGLCISGPVYDQIKNKLDLGYEDLGEQEVKNIREPVRVYKVFSTVSGRVIPS